MPDWMPFGEIAKSPVETCDSIPTSEKDGPQEAQPSLLKRAWNSQLVRRSFIAACALMIAAILGFVCLALYARHSVEQTFDDPVAMVLLQDFAAYTTLNHEVESGLELSDALRRMNNSVSEIDASRCPSDVAQAHLRFVSAVSAWNAYVTKVPKTAEMQLFVGLAGDPEGLLSQDVYRKHCTAVEDTLKGVGAAAERSKRAR
jgi:hypothetical protein